MPHRTPLIVATNRPLLAMGLRVAFDAADGLAIVDTASTALDLLGLLTSCPECIAVADARLFDGTNGAKALRLLEERRLTRSVVGVVHERPTLWRAVLSSHGIQRLVVDTDPVDDLVCAVEAVSCASRDPNWPSEEDPCRIGSAAPAQGLTQRELQVLALVAGGFGDTAISQQLELAPATVAFHTRQARQKLGAATRTQAVVLAIRHGWLPLD